MAAVVMGMVLWQPTTLHAEDRERWNVRNSGTKVALNGIAGNGKLWVAVGDGGTILTSSDATTWTPQPSPTKLNLNGVAWFHDRFVVVGDKGVILLSRDGVAWFVRDSRAIANLRSVAAGETYLVVVGDNGTINYSLDGSNWAEPATFRFSPGQRGGATPAAARGFSNRLGPGAFVTTQSPNLLHIVSTPNGYIIATEHLFLTSELGQIWTTANVAPSKPTPKPAPAAKAANSSATTPAPSASAPPVSPMRDLNKIISVPKPFTPRGGAGTPRGAGARRSAGAARGRGAVVVRDSLTSAAQSDDLTVAVGDNGQIWTSTKAGTWSRLDNASLEGLSKTLNDIYWSGRHFVTVGADGVILTSIDGTNWLREDIPTTESLLAVSSQTGLLVAVGTNGLVVTHDDLPVVAKPSISPNGGLFTTPPLVALNCPTPGVIIHYTLDGSEPIEDSAAYSQPFLMTKPGTLRVRAFKEGMDASLETSAVFQVPTMMEIIESPKSVRLLNVLLPGEGPPKIEFTIKTTDTIPPPTFQWQRKTAGSADWSDFFNENEDKDDNQISVLEVKYDPATSGEQFRCVVSNEFGQLISDAANLTYYTPVPSSITNQPLSETVFVDQTATFTVVVNQGDPPASCLWWVHKRIPPVPPPPYTPGLGSGWVPTGITSPTLTINHTTLEMNDDEFACDCDNGYSTPTPLFTNKVTLQVLKWPVLIVKQPSSVVATPGSIVNFFVDVGANGLLDFQWECQLPKSMDWQPLKQDLLYIGVNDPNLTIHFPSVDMSGYKYRCIVRNHYDDNQQISNTVVLTVK